MKSKADLVRGWLAKAESDLTNLRICLAAGRALDTACFHAQQAAEKYIKAYLTAHEIEFPFIHNLEKLIEICSKSDAAFLELKPLGQTLTPYAVDLRYDDDFWPSREATQQALEAAVKIKQVVMWRLHEGMEAPKLMAQNFQAIAEKGVSIDNAAFAFLKCGSCGSYYLYNEETMQLYLEPSLKQGRLALIAGTEDVCPQCGSRDSFVDAPSEDFDAVMRSPWAFAV